jgi:hypothetical protein
LKIVIVLVLGQHTLGLSVWHGAYTDACKDTLTVSSVLVYAGGRSYNYGRNHS